jgi:hypothetical protein
MLRLDARHALRQPLHPLQKRCRLGPWWCCGCDRSFCRRDFRRHFGRDGRRNLRRGFGGGGSIAAGLDGRRPRRPGLTRLAPPATPATSAAAGAAIWISGAGRAGGTGNRFFAFGHPQKACAERSGMKRQIRTSQNGSAEFCPQRWGERPHEPARPQPRPGKRYHPREIPVDAPRQLSQHATR